MSFFLHTYPSLCTAAICIFPSSLGVLALLLVHPFLRLLSVFLTSFSGPTQSTRLLQRLCLALLSRVRTRPPLVANLFLLSYMALLPRRTARLPLVLSCHLLCEREISPFFPRVPDEGEGVAPRSRLPSVFFLVLEAKLGYALADFALSSAFRSLVVVSGDCGSHDSSSFWSLRGTVPLCTWCCPSATANRGGGLSPQGFLSRGSRDPFWTVFQPVNVF